MAAAAAEEAADVNAPPFIRRRRLGASRDGAGARPAWLAGTRGRVCACAERHLGFNTCSALGVAASRRGVASSAAGPRARVRGWDFKL